MGCGVNMEVTRRKDMQIPLLEVCFWGNLFFSTQAALLECRSKNASRKVVHASE